MALALEGVDHVHGGDGLPLGVLGVGDGVLYYRRPREACGCLISEICKVRFLFIASVFVVLQCIIVFDQIYK